MQVLRYVVIIEKMCRSVWKIFHEFFKDQMNLMYLMRENIFL